MPANMGDYSPLANDFAACAFLVPFGEALWLASSSCSVIGRGMQKPVGHHPHGELVEVSVTGEQELLDDAVANIVLPRVLLVPSMSPMTMLHGAGATVGAGSGPGVISESSITAV